MIIGAKNSDRIDLCRCSRVLRNKLTKSSSKRLRFLKSIIIILGHL